MASNVTNKPVKAKSELQTDSNAVDKNESKDKTRRKNILVLINPRSGTGNSVLIYEKKLKDFLKSNNIDHECFITRLDFTVSQYIERMCLSDLNKFDSIVVVAGDGLVYETVNALMCRPDWQKAIGIPIAVIPTGSGNGMAYSLVRTNHPDVNDNKKAIDICCDNLAQGTVAEADSVKITYADKQLWSFLSIGWGLMSDIDVDSNWLRAIGEFRFTFYGLLRSLTSRSYRGRLSYQPLEPPSDIDEVFTDDKSTNSNSHPNEDIKRVVIEDKFACLYAVYLPYISSDTKFSPKSTLTDGLIYLTYICGKLSPCRVVEFLLAITDGSHENLSYVNVVPVKSFQFQPLEESKVVVDGEIIDWDIKDGPITAEVKPKMLKLLTSSSHTLG